MKRNLESKHRRDRVTAVREYIPPSPETRGAERLKLNAMEVFLDGQIVTTPQTKTMPALCPLARAALTPREAQVGELLLQGLSNREIGQRLGITERTVKQVLLLMRLKFQLGDRIMMAKTLMGAA